LEYRAGKRLANAVTGSQCQLPFITGVHDNQYSDIDCFYSWVTYLQDFQLSESSKAFQKGSIVTSVETSVFETLEGVGHGNYYTGRCNQIDRISYSHSPNVSTSRLISVTKTYWNPVSVSSIDWCSSHTGQPSCPLKVEGLTCDLFFEHFLKEREAKQVFGNRHMSVLSMVPKLCTFNDETMFLEDVCNIRTGSEVVLIYWPPNPVSRKECALKERVHTQIPLVRNQTRIMITTAITFKGQDLYLRSEIVNGTTRMADNTYVKPSVLHGLWTFTSPTIYLAHHAVSFMSAISPVIL
jgi:hypothetical protein